MIDPTPSTSAKAHGSHGSHGAPGAPGSHGAHGPVHPPEPSTPMWLPALGAFLFLIAGVWWMLTPPFSGTPAEVSPDPSGATGAHGANGAAGGIGAARDAGVVLEAKPDMQRFLQQHVPAHQ